MNQEFKRFLTVWQKVMQAKGGIKLPERADISISEFATWLPSMMIVKWDFDVPACEVLYAGSRIDDLFATDVKSAPLGSFFSKSAQIIKHVEDTKRGVSELEGVYVASEVLLQGGNKLECRQLRLPLAPEDSLPVTVSLFESNLEDLRSRGDVPKQEIREGQSLKAMVSDTQFVPLFDD